MILVEKYLTFFDEVTGYIISVVIDNFSTFKQLIKFTSKSMDSSNTVYLNINIKVMSEKTKALLAWL